MSIIKGWISFILDREKLLKLVNFLGDKYCLWFDIINIEWSVYKFVWMILDERSVKWREVLEVMCKLVWIEIKFVILFFLKM